MTRVSLSKWSAALGLALFATACGGATDPGQSAGNEVGPRKAVALPDEVKIGATLPLTGSGAAWGASISQAMNLAAKEINANGGVNGKNVKIAFEDHRAEAQQGASAFRKLAEVDGVPVVVTVNSGPVLAQIPIAEATKTLLFDSGTTSPQVRKGGAYVFSNVPKADDEAAEQARYAFEQLKFKKAAILSRQDESGTNFARELKTTFEKLGGDVVFEAAHQPDATDFRPALARLKASGAEVAFIPTYINEAATLLRQSVEMKVDVTWIAYSTVLNSAFIKQLGDASENLTFYASTLGWAPEEPAGPTAKFVKAYQAAYKEAPEFFGANAYDAVYVIVEAMKACDCYDPEGIAQGLLDLKPFAGVTGETAFDDDGMAVKPILWYRIKSDGSLERQK